MSIEVRVVPVTKWLIEIVEHRLDDKNSSAQTVAELSDGPLADDLAQHLARVHGGAVTTPSLRIGGGVFEDLKHVPAPKPEYL